MASGDREDPRIVRTREAVLGSVVELIAEGGWENVTHQHLAERSGYARSTIYRNWPDRLDLMRELSNKAEQRSHATAPTGALRDDLLADLLAFRDVLFDLGGSIVLTALLGLAEHSTEAAEILLGDVQRGEGLVRGLLADAARAGSLRSDLDPAIATSELFGPILYRRLMTRSRPTDFDIEALVDEGLVRWASRA